MRDVPTNATTRGSPSTVRRTRLQRTGSSVTDGRWPCARAKCSNHASAATTSASATAHVARQSPPGIGRGSELEVDEGTVLPLHEDDRHDQRGERHGAHEPRGALDDVLERAVAEERVAEQHAADPDE